MNGYIRLYSSIRLSFRIFDDLERELPEMYWWQMKVPIELIESDQIKTSDLWKKILKDNYTKPLLDLCPHQIEKAAFENKKIILYAITGRDATQENMREAIKHYKTAFNTLKIGSDTTNMCTMEEYIKNFQNLPRYNIRQDYTLYDYINIWFQFLFHFSEESGGPVISYSRYLRINNLPEIPYTHFDRRIHKTSILALGFFEEAVRAIHELGSDSFGLLNNNRRLYQPPDFTILVRDTCVKVLEVLQKQQQALQAIVGKPLQGHGPGRPQQYTQRQIENAYAAFNRYRDAERSVQHSWYLVAQEYGFPSWTAAKRTCERRLQ
jgi:hypothetical protein